MPFELEMTRFIRAPREKVFDAFVKRDALAAWICPRGMSVPEAAVDGRVGGQYRLVMRSREGTTFVVGGTYRELERPERIVFTWRWEGETMPKAETLVTVELEAREGGTALVMRHSGFPDAGMRDSHANGWRSSLNRLLDLVDERGTAATLTLIGDPRSTYVWTTRLALAEKGLAYTLEPRPPHSPEVLAVNPFGRIPAFRDGEIEYFETSAILRYLEEAFDGPSLLPATIRDRAACEQWTSAIKDYCYDAMVRRYVLQHVFPRGADGKPDRAVIEGALPDIRAQLKGLDRAYGDREWLVGTGPCMADLFLAPIVAYLSVMPEGETLLAAAPNVRRAHAAMAARQSFQSTQPPRG
jgi:glutathione S-transferase